MAIYHLHIDSYRRSRGRTAIGGVAYRRGLKAACRSSGKHYNFRDKAEVVFSEFVPAVGDETDYSQLTNLIRLYQSVEDRETHCRATVGREIEGALPVELNLTQQVELVRGFIAELRESVSAEQAFFDFSIHAKDNNPHTHICMSEREQLAPFTFAKVKRRDWDGDEFVRLCREIWERHSNDGLQKAGVEQRVSAASHADRGLTILPTLHQGKAAYFDSEVKTMNDMIRISNSQHLAKEAERQARKARVDRLLHRNRRNSSASATPPPLGISLPMEEPDEEPSNLSIDLPEVHSLPFGMECADLPGQKPYILMLLEQQYGQAFGFSPSVAFINLKDPQRTVLTFKDRSKLFDYGSRLECVNASPEASAERMLEIAEAKGWQNVVFTGDEAFLRVAFKLALMRGVNVYAKNDEQQKLLDEIRRVSRSAPASEVPALLSLSAIGSKLRQSQPSENPDSPHSSTPESTPSRRKFGG